MARRSQEKAPERPRRGTAHDPPPAGFERRYGKGDHWVYSHAKLDYRLTIDPARRLLPVYVSRAIRALEEVLDDEPED